MNGRVAKRLRREARKMTPQFGGASGMVFNIEPKSQYKRLKKQYYGKKLNHA